ncbi:DMT family transporter [Reyranella sp.]|uniref:DMT family transporter n=1 Tax=Reyranella sp. TaxID=1929291 RepID=UPI003D132620
MLFVGASWGANLPVTKVMLGHFDLMPMAAIRTATATATLALLVVVLEGRRMLRLELDWGRFLLLGLMMSSFFAFYAIGIWFSNPITAATIQVASPLVSAATVRWVTGAPFDRGFGLALGLTLLGGAILSASGLSGGASFVFGGGELIVLASTILWTLYSIKAQVWFRHASQLQRAYVASLSSTGWLLLWSVLLISSGLSRSPFGVADGWIWTQLLGFAVLASGVASYSWNVGASRLGVAIAALWTNLVPFFAVLWSMVYGFVPNAYQIVGGLVALSGVVYMQARKLQTPANS